MRLFFPFFLPRRFFFLVFFPICFPSQPTTRTTHYRRTTSRTSADAKPYNSVKLGKIDFRFIIIIFKSPNVCALAGRAARDFSVTEHWEQPRISKLLWEKINRNRNNFLLLSYAGLQNLKNDYVAFASIV